MATGTVSTIGFGFKVAAGFFLFALFLVLIMGLLSKAT
jgi:hypothetical protein